MGLRHKVAETGSDVLIVQAVFGGDPEDVIASLADMEEHIKPELKNSPIDPATVQWEPYVAPAERID